MKRHIPLMAVVCKLGTLAHNRAFYLGEFNEYTGAGRTTLQKLVKRGILEKVERHRYYPTAKGWKVIEKSCKLAGRR